jgi:hypothetical protein
VDIHFNTFEEHSFVHQLHSRIGGNYSRRQVAGRQVNTRWAIEEVRRWQDGVLETCEGANARVKITIQLPISWLPHRHVRVGMVRINIRGAMVRADRRFQEEATR